MRNAQKGGGLTKMRCSKCNNEMKKGFYTRAAWIEGNTPLEGKMIAMQYKIVGKKTAPVCTYACFECNTIEFKIESKK